MEEVLEDPSGFNAVLAGLFLLAMRLRQLICLRPETIFSAIHRSISGNNPRVCLLMTGDTARALGPAAGASNAIPEPGG